ncbi:hypothetical protein PRIPAC_82079, partial [Pristionchus pacificus]|uniref:Uncharacterized protein n=1 Tax=Pristionchus pacificus TaxID=54126 RepID=A0A2A6CBT9_PRIPA
MFGVRRNVDGRAVLTQESDSIPDDETGMLIQSDEEFDQFSDDEMANMELLASKVMRQRNHSLQQDFNNGRRVVDSICGYMNRRVEYLCRVCLRGTQNSTKTCCESRFLIFYVHSFGMIASIREIWRSKRSQMITVVSFSAVNQITHIFEKNENEILEIHREVHRVRAGSATRTRNDLHSSESFMDGVETKSQFDNKEIILNLSLSLDSYPFFRAGRGSATPLLISIQDLPARLRNKPENISMQCIMNYNMELLASRLGQSETAVSNVQSKISKQVMPVSYIRLYSLSSKTKTDYYKLPLDLLNGIKMSYQWAATAFCHPIICELQLLNLNNHIVGGHEYIPEGNASNFDIPIENECSEARDELDEVDVVTISETPKRSSERGLSQPPRKKIPKINRKLSIQRSSAFKMELTDSPTTQTERPSYTDLSGEKVQYQQYEVAAESSYPNGMMTQE